ncbi:glycoside hydrolase family 28 protein [Cellulosilyticum sp. I15G10I2]|uniref:glycoside hydrolase family 28 protein n=1 Tax=Cellulosilyticum sp. I15G10I2 TaxID=1892843 RepID=UPI00085C7D89|nr:glycoside hydrolase family 28 protein [Cellulosilyticum sp. I15G10I2]
MQWHAVNITATTITIELENESCYFSDQTYNLYVNDLLMYSVTTNVFTISNLKANQEYKIKLVTEDNTSENVQILCTHSESAVLNIRDFGAVGDGEHSDTGAIQAAISVAPKGARVVVPKGVYRCTAIFLKSHITLDLEEGAVLLGNCKREDYPILPSKVHNTDRNESYCLSFWEGEPAEAYASLITGIDLENVQVVGTGTIDANAGAGDWWVDCKTKRGAWRPRTIYLVNCKNVIVKGVQIKNSPSWTIHPVRCQQIQFINISIENPKDSPNTDGINPESCNDVEILGVNFSLGDDCVAIKSGKYAVRPSVVIPSENIKIRNCLMKYGHGAVVIGSEMSGGVKNVCVEKCFFMNTDRGIRIKTRRGRGSTAIVDSIYVKNIKMDGVLTPFTINSFYFCDSDGKTEYVWSKEKLPKDERTPLIGALTFENIHCINTEVCAGFMYGLPEEKIRSLSFSNIHINYKEDAQADYPEMLSFQDKLVRSGFIFKNILKLRLNNVSLVNPLGEALQLENIEDYLVE